MQFKVHVADRETGQESEIRVDALTVQQARAEANDAGYLVSSIVPLPTTAPAQQADVPSPAIETTSIMKVAAASGSPGLDITRFGAVLGPILGALMGYNLGGPLGIIVGAVCGILAGMGIGFALERNNLRPSGRFALAGITSGIAVALFCGFCILPLNWWNGLWSSGSKADSGTNSSSYNVERYSDADKALRVGGKNPRDVSSRDKAALQRSIQNLSDTLKGNEQYAPNSLDRAREYARSEYESNRESMSESEARRQFDKDLANIAQEARDKGVGR